MTKENKLLEFEKAVRPLMEYLNENHHPHTTIIVGHTNAQIFEGVKSFNTNDYLKD